MCQGAHRHFTFLFLYVIMNIMFTTLESAKTPEGLTSLETPRLILKPLTTAHAADIYRLVTSSGDLHLYTHIPEYYTEDDARTWVEKHAGSPYFFVLTDRATGEAMGVVSMVEYVRSHRRAEIGSWLGRQYRGQGLMAEALRAMVHDMLEKTEIEKIIARVLAGNEASAKTLENAGFKEEALLPKYEYHNGEMKDIRIFAINKS